MTRNQLLSELRIETPRVFGPHELICLKNVGITKQLQLGHVVWFRILKLSSTIRTIFTVWAEIGKKLGLEGILWLWTAHLLKKNELTWSNKNKGTNKIKIKTSTTSHLSTIWNTAAQLKTSKMWRECQGQGQAWPFMSPCQLAQVAKGFIWNLLMKDSNLKSRARGHEACWPLNMT